MRVAVTGSAGRLGRRLAETLSRHGHEVVPVDVDAGAPVDLTDPDAALRALEGAEAVVHLARERFPYTEQGLYDRATGTWRAPDVTGDGGRFQRNVAMTYNVLAAGVPLEISRFVMGSSLAVYGLYYPLSLVLPDYLPVDEDHPRRPRDPYGLSKLAGEELCNGFALRSGARIASLRFAGIADDAVYQRLMQRREDPMVRGLGSFWSYIDVRDAAEALPVGAGSGLRRPPSLQHLRSHHLSHDLHPCPAPPTPAGGAAGSFPSGGELLLLCFGQGAGSHRIHRAARTRLLTPRP